MCRKIRKLAINAKLDCSSNKPRPNMNFEQQSGDLLIKRCNEEAKQKYRDVIDKENRIKMPMAKKSILDKNANALTRELDTKEYESKLAKKLRIDVNR